MTPETSQRIVALLEELVEQQRGANERQQQALARSEQYNAEARERAERAIALQQAAVARQRWIVRVWIGLIVFIVAGIGGLLWALAGLLH